MKKAIAIMLLMLISFLSVADALQLLDTGYEQVMETEDKKQDGKDGKKDWKEYTAGNSHKNNLSLWLKQLAFTHTVCLFPQPVIDQPVPPPNIAC